jgi:yecA family protein
MYTGAMRTLPVRLLDLATALEDHDRESTTYYFDSQSGEIVFLTEDGRGSDKRWDIVSNNIDRFIDIEPMDFRQRQRIRQDFVATLPPIPLQVKLKWSLESGKPFRRFQDILAEDQALRKGWFEFHYEAMQKIALAWLADHDIEPIAPGPPAAPSLLDQEAEALAANEEEGNHDDAGEDEFDSGSDEEFEEFDEDDEGEPVDFLSEEEEALLTEFVESLPGANFSLAKLHGLCSAFAAGPVTMASADLLGVFTGFAKGGQVNDLANFATILDVLSRFYGGIVEALEFESFEPQLERTGDIVTEPSAAIISWCNGFMLGVDHHRAAWESWFKDARRTKAISLIEGMSAQEMLRQPENALDEETAWATIMRISELVPLIHAYWAFESALDGYLADRE